jgi:ABC-type sugar transport system permease subunit
MNEFWQSVTAWIKAHSITTHVLIVGIISAAGVIYNSTEAQGFISTIFKSPRVTTVVVAVSGLILLLISPHSDAGAIAKSNAIKDQPDAPTAAQVSAATPRK